MNAPVSSPLFRREVFEHRADRLHGDVQIAVPLSWQVVTFLIAIALFAAVTFFALGTYSRVETVTGAVVIDKGTAPIIPTRPGVIIDVLVHDGQRVAAGAGLARVRSEENLTNGQSAPEQVINTLRDQDSHLSVQGNMLLKAGDEELSRLDAFAQGLHAEIISIDQQIAAQVRLVSLANAEFHEIQAIATKGYLSRRDLEERESALLARTQALSQLRQLRSSKKAALAENSRAKAQARASAQAQAAGFSVQRNALTQQIAQLEGSRGFTLSSPIAGTITALTARLGQPAILGQALMIVVPEGGRERVELYVPTSAAGFLSVGQEARLSIDAFPYQRFGTIPARISEIATTPLNKPGSPSETTPVYLVTAELQRDWVYAYGSKQKLIPGMAVTARIVTQKQSLLQWLFEPIYSVARR